MISSTCQFRQKGQPCFGSELIRVKRQNLTTTRPLQLSFQIPSVSGLVMIGRMTTMGSRKSKPVPGGTDRGTILSITTLHGIEQRGINRQCSSSRSRIYHFYLWPTSLAVKAVRVKVKNFKFENVTNPCMVSIVRVRWVNHEYTTFTFLGHW